MTEEEQKVVDELVVMFPDFGTIWETHMSEEVLDEEDEKLTSIYTVAHEFSKYIIGLYIKKADST